MLAERQEKTPGGKKKWADETEGMKHNRHENVLCGEIPT